MMRIILASLAALLAQPAFADCPSPDLRALSAHAATVGGSDKRVHFVKAGDEAKDCPSFAAGCQARGYVVPGDVVLTGDTMGAFTCASFTGGTGVETYGWLPSDALSPLAGPAPADWAGHWRREEADLVIERAGAGLRIRGDATWGGTNPERVRQLGVNTGEIDATAAPVDGLVAFTVGADATLPYEQGDEFDCRAKLRRIGPYLVVADNGSCGGHNVSFSGVYRRK